MRQELAPCTWRTGRPADAERTYREDLEQFKNNGWSLYGLAQALEQQGKSAEAAKYKERISEDVGQGGREAVRGKSRSGAEVSDRRTGAGDCLQAG